MKIFLFLCALASVSAHAEWNSSSEAGIVLTSGNTKTQSYNTKNKTSYEFGKNSLRFDGNYMQAKQNGILNARYWLLGLRYERSLSEKFSSFLGETLESNFFAGFLQRYNSDAGAKYYLINKEKDFIWLAELGYRFTHEHTTSNTHKSYQKSRVYTELEKFWTNSTATKLWLEYVPNFTSPKAWLLNSEISLFSAITTTFSVKTAYGVKFNNQPESAATQKTDATFTTALVANF